MPSTCAVARSADDPCASASARRSAEPTSGPCVGPSMPRPKRTPFPAWATLPLAKGGITERLLPLPPTQSPHSIRGKCRPP
jgi:hypothetical protein